MRVIVYDCPDHPNAMYRCPTLRIFNERDEMVLQGILTVSDWRAVCEQIAAGVGAVLQVIGPDAARTRVGELLQPLIMATVDTPATYEVAKPDGWLF